MFGEGEPLWLAHKGVPLPKPHPFPKRALFRKMEATDAQRSPFAHSPPAHHKNDNKKARAASRLRCKKTAGRMAANTPPRVRKNIYLKTRPAPLQGKNEGSAKSTAKGKEPSSSPFPGNFQLSPGHTPATPPLTQTSFQRISPRPSPHTSGDRQQRLPAASRVTVKRPYERFLGDGGV